MLRGKFLSACVATVLAVGLPLSVGPQGFVPRANDTELNGIRLNGIMLNGIMLNGIRLNGIQLNGTDSTGPVLVSSKAQPIRVEGGQLMIEAEFAH